MNTQETARILDAVAKDFVPDHVDLLPLIAARFERRTLMQSLRARPALLILFVVLALSLLSGVVYALGRSLGYIPGVGLVDQSAAMRVLVEPVSAERDGIKLTVSAAVLSSDKSVVLYTIENVPWSALSHDERVGGCLSTPELHLPDGEVLHIKEGGGSMTDYRFAYAAIPAGVQEASFVLPCIMNTLPGLAPENWVLPLHFRPAPPDMTVVPVIEIAPTPTESQPAITPAATEVLPVTLTNAMQIDDSYVLSGTLKRPGPASAIQINDLSVTDANGAQIFINEPQIPGLPYFDWGAQFKAGTVSFPVTLTFTGVQIRTLTDPSAEFEFDAGEQPQPGQEWTLNQPVRIAGRMVKLVTVRTDGRSGYSFAFSVDPDVNGFSLEIVDHSADGGGGGGDNQGKFSVGLAFSKLPTGKLKIRLSNLRITSPTQTWKLQWSPENPPPSASLYGISLHVDQFITLPDGYYLVGHTEWTDERIQSINPPGDMQASDARGQAVALEDANGQVAGLTQADNQWVYKIYGKVFSGPLTLHARQLGLTFKDPLRFSLDLRPYNFSFSDDKIGVPYKTGLIPLAVPGLTVNVGAATYIKSGDQRGFKFTIDADPRLQMLGFRIESGLDTSGMAMVSRGNSSYRDEQTGLLISEVTTDAPMTFPIVFTMLETGVSGDWTVSWTAPASLTPMPSAAPTPTAAALPAQPSGVDRATFVSETYPDYTVLAPGEQFIKTWNIKNTGISTWNTAYRLARVSTPQNETLGSPIEIPFPEEVPPGAAAAFSISLTAPKAPGTYAVYWSLENERKQSFGVDGDRVWVLIKVCETGQPCPQTQSNAAISISGISASLSSFTAGAQVSTASFCMTLPNRNYAPAPGSVSLLLDQQAILAATGSSLPGGCYEFEFPVSAAQLAQAKSAAVSIGQVRIVGGVAEPQAACLSARLSLMARYPGLDFQCSFSQAGYYTDLQLPAGLSAAQADALIVDAIEGAVYGPWLLNVKN